MLYVASSPTHDIWCLAFYIITLYYNIIVYIAL